MLQANPATGKTLRIVVADGDAADRKTIAELLSIDKTLLIEQASSENDLMALLADREVGCVLIESNVGSESGFAINDRVKEKYPDSPAFIMLTGTGSEDTVIKALRCGFSDYLKKKPLTSRKLVDAVWRAVGRRRAEIRRKSEFEYLAKLSRLDILTGLPNREFLDERLTMLLAGRRGHGSYFAVLKIDINDFNVINDSFGHAVGDVALRSFAARLKNVSRSSDMLGRFVNDEFLYLIDWDVSEQTTELACRRLADASSFSIDLENVGLSLSASIGAAIYPVNGMTATDLLEAAEQAMSSARASGGGYALAPLLGSRSGRSNAALSVNGAADRSSAAESVDTAFATPRESLIAAMPPPDLSRNDPQVAQASDETSSRAVRRDENRRKERRNRVLKRGIVVINDGFSTMNCLIRDLSPHGARITLEGDFTAHPRFSLLVVETGERFPAERRWQRGRDVGVTFVT